MISISPYFQLPTELEILYDLTPPLEQEETVSAAPRLEKEETASIPDQEAELREGCLRSLESLKRRLFEKYPSLENGSRTRAFKAQELFFQTFPAPLDLRPIRSFVHVIEALIEGNNDAVSTGIVLDRLLTRESSRPTSADIVQAATFKALEKATREKIYDSALQRSTESTFSDIFYVHHSDGEGKFKPLPKLNAMKEAYGAQLDRIFGFEMTIPTRFFQKANFWQPLEEVRLLFFSASREEQEEDAERLKKRAMDKLHSTQIPAAVRNAIFGETYALYGKRQMIDCLGEKLFYDREGYRTSPVQKARAIQKYIDSDVFKEHVNNFQRQGSIQPWVRDCGRAYDLIVKDPEGGDKLKSAPKALVHLYALMGILKGSMDGSSGNTFIAYDPALGRVVNLLDFDDDRSMPEQNNWWSFRLWQLGLPQCEKPFDRAVLLLFADQALVDRLKKHKVLGSAHAAQLDRFTRMQQLFNEELKKKEITLTPRDLFFRLFGGREHYDYVKSQFTSITPIELFEFHLAEIGRGMSYTEDEFQKTIVVNNLKALYPEPF